VGYGTYSLKMDFSGLKLTISNKMKIPGILELNSRTKYGMTSRNTPMYLFRPLDTSAGLYIVGSTHKDTSSNVLAMVDVDSLPPPKKLTRANLVSIIGKCGDMFAEKEALLNQYYSTPWKKFDITTPSDEIPLLKGFTFNVDPIGCRDIDDVFTIGDDGFFYITIADVGAWFVANPQHPFIKTASQIGQTIYDDGKAVGPLLPIESECSLLPGVKRLGVSLKFKWTGTQIEDISFQRTTIINNLTFTYESIYNTEYSKILDTIGSYLAKRRIIDSHEWIEQLMLFYNCEAAKVLAQKKNGLMRIHAEPDHDKLELYKTILGSEARFLAYKSAEYVWALDQCDKRHWGLNADNYCHATSPIRRYADILNQLILTDRWNPDWIVSSDQLNNLSKRAKKYHRDAFFLQSLFSNDSKSVDGIVVNDHRIWVPDWKRMVTCKNVYTPGTSGVLKYSLDLNQTTWKRRMVFRFEDTGYLG
jgi:exoribonuclease R